MQHSRSFGSFVERISSKESINTKPRGRSSLDSFLIPGRTRVPSNKPEAIDVEIAQHLLDPKMIRTVPPTSDDENQIPPRGTSRNIRTATSGPEVRQASDIEPSKDAQPVSGARRSETSPNKNPFVMAGREPLIIPHRRPRSSDQQSRTERKDPPSPHYKANDGVYDGASGTSYESRVTSMTWSTVSHRILSDSSGSSQGLGALEALGLYNRLAGENGILELERCPGDETYEKKITRKVHHHGWLARKLFRRSSSMFTLEMKTTQKPVTRKISLGKIPKLTDGERKNILNDKTLEEMSRLGGLGLFVLPSAFAADKLTLPTCLSAVATYLLQNGRNQGGIFRLSGTSSTVNQLYDFYAYQFSQAGSPSKVRETVGSGQLPSHIMYSLHDVASFFKKIIISLPGGLLGSLELFEALRSIFFRLSPKATQSDADLEETRARLIALAISSVTSQYRIQLIEAVLGLAAHFGDEAEMANAALDSGENADAKRTPSSELMGYQSLGVVLGPLLLGRLTDSVELNPSSPDTAPRRSMDSGKKVSRKQKRASLTTKLDRDTLLSDQVDRANLTANVTELLLISWKGVVVQLKKIHGSGSDLSQSKESKHIKKMASRIGSRMTLRNSEEEMMFLDALRGRTLPDDLRGKVRTKKKVRVSSRSPMSRTLPPPSKQSMLGPVARRGSSDEKVARKTDRSAVHAGHASRSKSSSPNHSPSTAQGQTSEFKQSSLGEDKKSKSDISLDPMAMGTILPRLQDEPVTPLHRDLLRQVSNLQTPHQSPSGRAGAESRVSVDRYMSSDSDTKLEKSEHSTNKPLPIIGDAQRAELDMSLSDEDPISLTISNSFPARKSSLPTDKRLPPRPHETPILASKESKDRTINSRSSSLSGSQGGPGSTVGSTSSTDESRKGSVRALAQRFAEVSRANRKAQEMDNKPYKVFAEIRDVVNPQTPDQSQASLSSRKTSPGRSTLIPKPRQEAGSPRKIISSSPSPTKIVTPKHSSKHGSMSSAVTVSRSEDTPAERISARSDSPQTTIRSKPVLQLTLGGQLFATPTHARTDSGNLLEVAPTRPLSAYSSESIRRTQLEEDPPVAQHVHAAPSRVISFDVDAREDHVKTTIHDTSAPGLEVLPLKRTGSINATLLTEISRLKRQLELKTQEVESTKRSLDAVRDAREIITPGLSPTDDVFRDRLSGSISARGSVKGTLSEEVRLARKEKNEWRRRAEWAEGRLAALEGEAGKPSDLKT